MDEVNERLEELQRELQETEAAVIHRLTGRESIVIPQKHREDRWAAVTLQVQTREFTWQKAKIQQRSHKNLNLTDEVQNL